MTANTSAAASSATERQPLLRAEQVTKYFTLGGLLERIAGKRTTVQAVRAVSLTVGRGETLGIVGESGCGKSTLGRTLLRLYTPTSGRILFDGQDISTMSEPELRPMRKRLQMIFQDPRGSLNPRQSVDTLLHRALGVHGVRGDEAVERVALSLRQSGLDPSRFAHRYPRELSGGEAQRVGIARALLLEPDLIIADEPVSSLDVTVQAQIVNLLMRLRGERRLTMAFISHDMAVVRHISDRVLVMYLGRVMEDAPAREIFRDPLHPYTKALMDAIPRPGFEPVGLKGQVPSPSDPPPGCPFQSRCPKKIGAVCETVEPVLTEVEAGRKVACHLHVAPEEAP
ncbi:ABC transporter ATP-binding protein [Nonomuraea sp. K274]|uniref:ABC transporter ATP-binding protein n=1 Tax=Nonomuraea cypriaca TaxID=1187855 RepID=A0A931A519_9ACTN|nr:ABC transporter ATP-binding protein [Nonomuraea cypriaca]MBF8184218.1 ABC transporter ATP-binding protein [Nonomuraea cypriaca]